MASLHRKLETDQIRYTIAQLTDMRRKILRFARSLPPGSRRDQHRQIAAKLRHLFRNKVWLDAHTVAGPVTQYQIHTLDTDGNSFSEIELDSPDDRAAVESARQFIDGHDIELWQGDRKVIELEHKD